MPIWRLVAIAITNISIAVLHATVRPIAIGQLLHRLREPPRRRRAIAHRRLS
ncbi:hypothetical protein IE4803_CH03159 [Rhizobium etli bv. phaseoli str. IE4803]|nr:hypothetical protein IE4803_CH03159 [Rhizobium etli bv. phaseoli str. IE4803]